MSILRCSEYFRLLNAYNEAIVLCYSRPNGRLLNAATKAKVLEALIVALSKYQEHVKTHRCAEEPKFAERYWASAARLKPN